VFEALDNAAGEHRDGCVGSCIHGYIVKSKYLLIIAKIELGALLQIFRIPMPVTLKMQWPIDCLWSSPLSDWDGVREKWPGRHILACWRLQDRLALLSVGFLSALR